MEGLRQAAGTAVYGIPALIAAVYAALVFGPEAPLGADLLALERMPWHASVTYWFGWEDCYRLGILLLALILLRGSPLFDTFAIALSVCIAGIAIQAMSQSSQLGLLFPWRVSVILVPLAHTILAYKFSYFLSGYLSPRMKPALYFAIVSIPVATYACRGLIVPKPPAPAQALWRTVENQPRGQFLYMVPPEMKEFRLETGKPVYVDFKSHPYLGSDVVRWQQRLRFAQTFYSTPFSCSATTQLTTLQVTHIVAPAEWATTPCGDVTEVYRDAHYVLLALLRNDSGER
jgi:hypothetical protein